ncbi:helix-turn-helix transcriptional regulator [Asticcacaulis sp.]|uniref:helix-turn-helix domain-containing protein n=1 Tax=Asticcacaulis sp. TaxID=1872648 RepID=UPI002BE3BF62|nr:helix-turn-helix transcriptional regulator [Asticcacaulis sp.]HTM81560.1 helix-turn-helix transcriptional regulator [Asticcacaulis sp.]
MALQLKQRFGYLVAAHRKRRGMTQAQLGEAAEISTDMVARIEGGSSGARFQTVEKLAAALKVDPAELFTADIPSSALARPKLSAITRRLSKESDADLDWLAGMLDSLLKKR